MSTTEQLQETTKDVTENEEDGDPKEDPEQAMSDDEEPPDADKLTYREKAMKNGMSYTVTDVPPLGTSLVLGLQHYLTMLGATVLIPLIVCPAMGANGQQTAQVISSIFFVSGINTVSCFLSHEVVDVFVLIVPCLSHFHTVRSNNNNAVSSCKRPLATVFPLSKADRLLIFHPSSRSSSTMNFKPLKTTRNASR